MGCATANHSNGIIPGDLECDMIVRGGNVCQGYCYPVATVHSNEITNDSVTIVLAPGTEGSMWANVRGSTGATSIGIPNSIYAVALENVLDLGVGKFKIRGLVYAYVKNINNTAIVRGKPLVVAVATTTASVLEAGVANVNALHTRYLGHVLEANASTPSVAAKLLVNFDGMHGFGAGNGIA